MEYDLVIVGAGSAGCIAAYTAAKRGFDVCLIDAKPKNIIGNKICGNGFGYHHAEKICFTIPEHTKTNEIEGIIIYSPSGYEWKVSGGKYNGVMLNRLAFGQYLLNRAIESGAELKDKTIIKGPIVKNDFVKGVITYSGEIYADVVIDAAGLRSPIRSKLPESFGIETEIGDKDVNVGYREIRKVRHDFKNKRFCEIYLNPDKFPGGYAWIFPQSNKTVNVGLGVQKLKNCPNPRKRLYETVLKMELFENSELIEKGGMDVSTRRSLSSLVGNGVLIAGEAGSIIDPVIGGGNGQALVTGKFAAEVACDALENERIDKESLWNYNLKYFAEKDSYGQKYTPVDAFRIFLQSLSPKDLDYAREHEIIKEGDLISLTTEGELKLSITEKAKRFFEGINRISLLKDINYIKNVMQEIKIHCSNYPNHPEELNEWEAKIDLIFSDLEQRFEPYKPKF